MRNLQCDFRKPWICGIIPPLGRGRIAYLQEIFQLSRAGANKWLHGHAIPHRKTRQIIAEKLGINLHWLETGEGSPMDNAPMKYEASSLARKIPLMSLSHAYDLNSEEFGKGSEHVVVNSESQGCYAVKHVGESMLPRFSDGAILIIASQQEVRDGEYVLAKSNRIPEAIFRQYIIGANNKYLVPFNARFETIEIPRDKNIIIGKVIEVRTESL